MTSKSYISPGTVSNILWHFTGGPTWNDIKKRQNKSRKNAAKAYNNLVSILKEKRIRTGNYKERVVVNLPHTKLKSVTKIPIESSPICSLADIPAQHLNYHANRYGKFAIGFYRDSIIKNNFNPVFYTLEDAKIINKIFRGLSSSDLLSKDKMPEDLLGTLVDYSDINSLDNNQEVLLTINFLKQYLIRNRELSLRVSNAFSDLLAFTKTFSNEEFNTIYCEREWRSIKPFKFAFNDVAMIVVPKQVGKNVYFSKLIDKDARILHIPRRIPIVPWEDLIEH